VPRLYGRSDVADLVVIEIKPGYRIVALGLGGFFFDAQRPLLPIKIHHAVTFGVMDVISKHRRTRLKGIGPVQ